MESTVSKNSEQAPKSPDNSSASDVRPIKRRNTLSNSSFSESGSGEDQPSSQQKQESSIFDPANGQERLASQIAHFRTHKRHKEYELTYDMMLGIRTFVSMSNVKPMNTLDINLNFKEKQRLFFPSEGSTITPPHAMRPFHFTDYSSEAFKRLRTTFGVNPADYLVDLCGDFAYLKFLSNSKSGQFFFYSHDRKYLIKTINKDEKAVLRRIIENYYNYMIQQPNSLLTRFVGLHSVEVKGIGKKYFIIMLSVFKNCGEKDLKYIYDLKGSSYGRNASQKDKEKETPTLKDNDARENELKLKVGELKNTFAEQIKLDSEFLRRRNIIDYSLLVGGVKDEKMRKDEEKGVRKTGGGMKDGEVIGEDRIYYMGIIDILVEYKIGKKMESFFKGLVRDRSSISVVDPNSYSKRFQNFISGLLE